MKSRYQPISRRATIDVPISDIIDAETSTRAVCVLPTATNKPCWMPRKHTKFLPGAVRIPIWLYTKLFLTTPKG